MARPGPATFTQKRASLPEWDQGWASVSRPGTTTCLCGPRGTTQVVSSTESPRAFVEITPNDWNRTALGRSTPFNTIQMFVLKKTLVPQRPMILKVQYIVVVHRFCRLQGFPRRMTLTVQLSRRLSLQ